MGARPVIVEGPLDAIAVTTAGHGMHIGVAPCGTALTAQQAAALASTADLRATGVTVAFDPDQAGRRAVRAYHLLVPHTENSPPPPSQPGRTQPRSSSTPDSPPWPRFSPTGSGHSLTSSSTPKSPAGADGCATPKDRSTRCAQRHP